VRYTFAAAAVVVAWSAAIYVHQRNVTHYGTACGKSIPSGTRCPSDYVISGAVQTVTHPAWEDTAAIVIALGGLAVALRLIWVFTDSRTLDAVVDLRRRRS
jgi:hypothetical protein